MRMVSAPVSGLKVPRDAGAQFVVTVAERGRVVLPATDASSRRDVEIGLATGAFDGGKEAGVQEPNALLPVDLDDDRRTTACRARALCIRSSVPYAGLCPPPGSGWICLSPPRRASMAIGGRCFT